MWVKYSRYTSRTNPTLRLLLRRGKQGSHRCSRLSAASVKLARCGLHLSQAVLIAEEGHYQLVEESSSSMIWTIAVILLVLWLLGFITKYTLGGWIHILLVIAIVVVIINLIQGRRVS